MSEEEKPKSALEKEMEAMLAQTASFMSDSEAVKKEGGRIRRKSKELEAELSGMQEASEQWVALAGVGRPRRNSKEFTDEELEAAFKEMDADGSGAIDPAELEAAIRKMDPTISKAKCAELVQWADEDGDGEVDFEEFKKIMLYKRARLLKVPSALFEDSAPCARPAAPKAQAARFDPH